MKNTAKNTVFPIESPGFMDNKGAMGFAHAILLAGSILLLIACL